jgi:hypothetical protein
MKIRMHPKFGFTQKWDATSFQGISAVHDALKVSKSLCNMSTTPEEDLMILDW